MATVVERKVICTILKYLFLKTEGETALRISQYISKINDFKLILRLNK